MIKNIFTLSMVLTLAACSAKVTSEEVAPPGSNQKAGGGPFAVDFNNPNNTYQHSFKLPIDQEEGKVEYFINTPDAATISFVETNLRVTGCSASNVIHQTFWIPNSAITEGQYVIPNSTFRTQAGIQGTLMHILRGLKGCTDVELLTTLKKQVVAAPKCENSNDAHCRVEVICKEKNPLVDYTTVVEVWNESWGRTMRQYGVSAGRPRSLILMHSVNSNTYGNQLTYRSTAGDPVSLRIDTQTLEGVYTIDSSGMSLPYKYTCTIH